MEPLVVKSAIVVFFFVAFFVCERLSTYVKQDNNKGRLFRNLVMWATTVIVSPLIVLPLAKAGENITVWQRPEWGLGIGGLFVSLILLDLWAYWLHRAYHVVPFMWRLHAPHHLDEHLDSTSAFRFHFLEVALSGALRMIPIILFAIPFYHVLVFEIFLTCAAIFHHSNIRLAANVEKRLSMFIVTPSIHWVHHHATDQDTNSNFAVLISAWDRLFKSRSRTIRSARMKIGIQGIEDQSILRLILFPIKGII